MGNFSCSEVYELRKGVLKKTAVPDGRLQWVFSWSICQKFVQCTALTRRYVEIVMEGRGQKGRYFALAMFRNGK